MVFHGTSPDGHPFRLFVHRVGSATHERHLHDYPNQFPRLALERGARPGFAVFATPEECAAHEQGARSAALDDARHKADAIAALTGVSIDGVAAVSEAGGCPYGIDPSMGGFGSAQLDLARLTANVTVIETVTFSITTATGPSRRRPL